MLTACGDGDSSAAPSTPTTTAAATTAAPTALPVTASGAMPDLASLGFARQAPEKINAPGGLDIAFSVYEKSTEPRMAARAEVRVYASEGAAKQDYPTQALGWRNPPPQVFGGDLGNVTSPPLSALDEATAYTATKPDPSGNRVWTDVFRVGRVVVVAHVLAKSEDDARPVREALATAIRDVDQ